MMLATTAPKLCRRSACRRQDGRGQESAPSGKRHDRAGIRYREDAGGGRRTGRDLQGGRFRLAGARVLHVPRDERRPLAPGERCASTSNRNSKAVRASRAAPICVTRHGGGGGDRGHFVDIRVWMTKKRPRRCPAGRFSRKLKSCSVASSDFAAADFHRATHDHAVATNALLHHRAADGAHRGATAPAALVVHRRST